MSSNSVVPDQAPPRPHEGRTIRVRAGTALVALSLALTACGEQAVGLSGNERMAVLQDGSGEGISEWTASAEDYDDHPHIPVPDVAVDVTLPVFPTADAFTEALKERVDEEVADFRAGTRDPVSLGVDWELVAAGEGVLGVRLVRSEEDMHGMREGYSTHWYDATAGHSAHSTELLAGQEALDELDAIVGDELADDEEVDGDTLYPVLRTYDSIGFNENGDLVVEFDDGHLSPVIEGHVPSTEFGRKVVIVDHETAAPLLSDLGERARQASMTENADLEPAEFEEDDDEEAPPPVPGVFDARLPDVDCEDDEVRCVALTFDDGPVAATSDLLDLLAAEKVTASFFLNGSPVLTRPGPLRRAYSEGHEIASHGDLHEHMNRMDAEELPSQVASVSAMVRRQTGHTVELFRPPFGATDDDVHREISDQGMVETLWTVDSEDWEGLTSDEIVDRVVDLVEPGGVVLMHDPQEATLDAVPEIIRLLRDEGYEFVPASQAMGFPEPPHVFPEDWDGSW